MKLNLLIICYSIQISLVLSAEPRVDPLVLIQQGIVRGHRESDGDYSTFLGISYAQVDLDNPFGPAAPLSGFQGNKRTRILNIDKKCLPSRLVPVGVKDYYPPNQTSQSIKQIEKRTDYINILTLNTRTLQKPERLIELEQALSKTKWDILGLSEIRRIGENIIELQECIFYHYGETKGLYGVGFLVHKKWRNHIIEFKGVTERIATLKLKLSEHQNIEIIQVYSPTNPSDKESEEKVKDFYEKLANVVKNTKESQIIIMGDFNARIGERRPFETDIIGPYSTNIRNDNGQLMIDFCAEFNLKILNTFFKKRLNRKWTWLSPDSYTKAEIDFIVVKNSDNFQDVDIINNFQFYSDHRVLRSRLRVKNKNKQRKIMKSILGRPQFTNTEKNRLFSEEISTVMHKITEKEDLQSRYKTLTEELKTAANKHLVANKESKSIFSEETMLKIKQRSELVKVPNKTKQEKNQLTELNKATKKSIRKDKRKFQNNAIKRFLDNNTSITKLEKYLNTEKKWIPYLQASTNKTPKILERKLIAEEATEFYKKLYSSNISEEEKQLLTPDLCNQEEVPKILESEVEKAISGLNNDKACGEDGINCELLKIGQEHLVKPAAPLSGFQGVFNAYDASMKCPQNPDSEETLDCLRLNIYVPNEASSLNPLPVLVWVHGGGFAFGSGAEFNPAKLVRHGIVVVTINYRLGPYGFMCLDVPSVPGNQGIKDQFEALRWIRNNIAAFGGNPYQVTLAGESAGSACVLYHLYSSNQKLYNKVIVQSDTPQNEGMFVQKDTNAALKLAEHLGLNTSDTEEALRFLANISPNLVIGATRQLNLQLKPCKENVFNGVDNIITSDPLSLSNLRKVQNTPVLIGHTTREHLGVLLEMYGSDYLNKDPFYEKLNDHFNLDDEELDKVAKIVRHFYIGDEPVSVDVLAELEDFDSDFVFNHPVQSTINNLLNENANAVYEYLFSYVGDSGAVATGHAAENDYLFVRSELDQSEDDELIVDRITTLWSNFVKFGNPTPEATSLLPVSWKPVSRDARPYLVIDTDMRLQSRVFKGRMSFWDLFYAIYGSYDRFIDE